MEERRITVKKGEWPLDYLAAFAEEGKSAWAFFDKHIVEILMRQAGYKTVIGKKTLIGVKESLGAKQNANLCLHETMVNEQKGWTEVLEASAKDVEFKGTIGIPDVILLLEMEE